MDSYSLWWQEIIFTADSSTARSSSDYIPWSWYNLFNFQTLPPPPPLPPKLYIENVFFFICLFFFTGRAKHISTSNSTNQLECHGIVGCNIHYSRMLGGSQASTPAL